MALGDNALPRNIAHQHLSSEIAGLTFQKVDTGFVKALLLTDSFSPVTWEDAPTKLPPGPQDHPPGQQRSTLNLNNQIQLGQANHVPPQWLEFTNMMGHAKNAILTRVSSCIESVYQAWKMNWVERQQNDVKLNHYGTGY